MSKKGKGNDYYGQKGKKGVMQEDQFLSANDKDHTEFMGFATTDMFNTDQVNNFNRNSYIIMFMNDFNPIILSLGHLLDHQCIPSI